MTKAWMVGLMVAAGCGAPQKPEPPRTLVAIELTSEGLKPFPTGEIDKASLEATYVGYDVATDDGVHFAIRDAGDTVIHLDKTESGARAKVTGALVAGPRGVRVGSQWEQFGKLRDIQCRRGAAPWADIAFCTAEVIPNIVFGFDIKGLATPGCAEACVIEDLSGMLDKKVRYMDWQP